MSLVYNKKKLKKKKKKDGHYLEILFADCNLNMHLLIDFKLDKVEGQNPALF